MSDLYGPSVMLGAQKAEKRSHSTVGNKEWRLGPHAGKGRVTSHVLRAAWPQREFIWESAEQEDFICQEKKQHENMSKHPRSKT